MVNYKLRRALPRQARYLVRWVLCMEYLILQVFDTGYSVLLHRYIYISKFCSTSAQWSLRSRCYGSPTFHLTILALGPTPRPVSNVSASLLCSICPLAELVLATGSSSTLDNQEILENAFAREDHKS
jgi:hypothetical protein